MRIGLMLGACALVVAGLSACGGSPGERAAEAAIEAASGQKVDVERDGETMTFEHEDGTRATVSNGDALALPEGFPDDLYRPDGRITNVIASGDLTMIGFQSDLAPQALADAVGRSMAGHGWKQVMAMQGEAGSMLAFEKDGRNAALTYSANDGGGSSASLQLTSRN
jgi:hypothetical protein